MKKLDALKKLLLHQFSNFIPIERMKSDFFYVGASFF